MTYGIEGIWLPSVYCLLIQCVARASLQRILIFPSPVLHLPFFTQSSMFDLVSATLSWSMPTPIAE